MKFISRHAVNTVIPAGLLHFNSSISADPKVLPAWKYLEQSQSAPASTWCFTERCTIFILSSIAIFGLLIYFLELIFAIGLLSRGLAFSCNFLLMNPFDPSSRFLRKYREEFLHSAHPTITHCQQNFLNSVQQTIQIKIIVLSAHLIIKIHRPKSAFFCNFWKLFP